MSARPAAERGVGERTRCDASGVVLEHLPRWATEDAGKGQRLPRLTKAGRWLLLSVLLVPVGVCIYLSRYRLDYALFPDVSETPGRSTSAVSR